MLVERAQDAEEQRSRFLQLETTTMKWNWSPLYNVQAPDDVDDEEEEALGKEGALKNEPRPH